MRSGNVKWDLLPFNPLFRNPHVLTILANFARRRLDTVRFPITEKLYQTDPDAQVLVHEQRPPGGSAWRNPHGARAGRFERRGLHPQHVSACAGERICRSSREHAQLRRNRVALQNDVPCRTHVRYSSLIRQIREQHRRPVYLIGYSLGGNVALKLAGELGDEAEGLLDAVIAVSTPIDLAASVRKMSRRENWIYESRFVSRLKQRIRRRARKPAGGLRHRPAR